MAGNEPTVMQLIDAELERLREPLEHSRYDYVFWGRRSKRKAWLQGVNVARSVAAERLQKIRDAYMDEPPRARQVGMWCEQHRRLMVGQWPEPCEASSCVWVPAYVKKAI